MKNVHITPEQADAEVKEYEEKKCMSIPVFLCILSVSAVVGYAIGWKVTKAIIAARS